MQPVHVLLSPEHHEVLHHFFAEVVINSVDLLFGKEGRQVSGQLFRTLEVMSEWLLHDHPVPASTHTHTKENRVIWIHDTEGLTLESISILNKEQ